MRYNVYNVNKINSLEALEINIHLHSIEILNEHI